MSQVTLTTRRRAIAATAAPDRHGDRLAGVIVFGLVPAVLWTLILMTGAWLANYALDDSVLLAVACTVFVIASLTGCLFVGLEPRSI